MDAEANIPSSWSEESASKRDAVRRLTRAAHERAEAAMARHAPFDAPDGYGRFLDTMLVVQLAFADTLDWTSGLVGLGPRAMVAEAHLRRDLDVLDVTPRLAPELQEVADAERLGVLYAMEGSALGARGIREALRDAEWSEGATAYLDDLVIASASRWPVVIQALDGDDVDPRAVARGAEAVFDLIVEAVAAPRS